MLGFMSEYLTERYKHYENPIVEHRLKRRWWA